MPQPYNYMIDIGNPVQSALQGYQAAQNMQLNQERIAAVEAAKQQKAIALQQQQEQQRKIAEFAAIPNKTVQDYKSFLDKNPTMYKALKEPFDMLSEDEKKADIYSANRLFSAIESGNTEMAGKFIDEEIDANKNSGREDKAKFLEMMKQQLEMGPEGEKALKWSSGMFLTMAGDKDFAERFEKTQAQLREQQLQPGAIAKQKQEVINLGIKGGLDKAEAYKKYAEIRKLDKETQKILMEIEMLDKTNGLTPEKRFDLEQKLSDKYYKRSEDYLARRVAFDNLLESAKDSTGAGDYALVKSFEKMLEPNSAVLDGEFAKAQASSGKLSQLLNTFAKFTEGTTFKNDAKRQYYVNLAKKYMQSAERYDDIVRKDITRQIERYNLDPGLLPERRPIQETDLAKIKAQKARKVKTYKVPKVAPENQAEVDEILRGL